ncbi:MAG: phosphate acyltransferase PlsX [Firmicutes bacterium]|nr:phosphate acyltransferase PlsX [Bacillota bacterium]
MRIILDAMGGDNAPLAIVKGALEAAPEIGDNKIALVGPKEKLYEILCEQSPEGLPHNMMIFGANDVITNNDHPVKAIKSKPESTIVTGLTILKDELGDVFVSAGNTGALLVGGLMICGRIKGVERPAICSIYPIIGGKASLLVDAGANAECKPRNLYEFAIMGSVYMEKVLGRENPKVGLLNIGAEAEKGTSITKKAYELLSESDLNFIGNVEARDIPDGVCDVIVADGFTGNVVLKLTEGLAGHLFRSLAHKIPKDALNGIMGDLDYSVHGGAPILGVTRPIIKMHGSSGPRAVKSAILKAIDFVETDVVGTIKDQVR